MADLFQKLRTENTDKVTEVFDDSVAEELLARARGLSPLFKRNSARSERDCRLPDENFQAMKDAGLFKIIVPRSDGGYGASWTTNQRITHEISKVCPSTGWMHALMGVASFYFNMMPDAVKEQIREKDGSTPAVSGVISLGGVIEPTEGGYIANARWPYSTGCYHAKWASGAVSIKNKDGTVTPGALIYVPKDKFRIEDTWDVAGMRGTGSATVVVDNAFIPEDCVVPPNFQIDRTYGEIPEGVHASARWPLWALLAGSNTAVALGAAETMLDLTRASLGKRGITYTYYQRGADSAVAQAEVAKSALKIYSARLIMYDTARELDRKAVDRETICVSDRTFARGAHGFACELLRQAADGLLTVYGTGAFASSNQMQLLWRDINVITRHGLVASNNGYEAYGKSLLDVEPINILQPYL